jgi:hypothetical protein
MEIFIFFEYNTPFNVCNFLTPCINLTGSVGAYVCLKVIKVSVDVLLCPFSASRSIWFHVFTVPNLRVNGKYGRFPY